MTSAARGGGVRRRLRRALLAASLLAAGGAAGPQAALAQETPPPRVRPPQEAPDTLPPPPDTAAAPADSAAPAPADTTPPPHLPRLPDAGPEGWAADVWTWDHGALLATGALTLTDLLERIPGVTTVRYGLVGLPELASGLGGTAGRIELFLDGFALDPLGEPGVDLSRIQLTELQSVRVSRGLGSLRVELETLSPWERAAYSRIEAGTGQYGTDLLRGLLLAPRFLGGSLGLAVERLASDGARFAEPAENFGGWAKWTLAGPGRGLQLEYRRASISRRAGGAFGSFQGERTDLVLRSRIAPAQGLVAEAFVGRSTLDDRHADTLRLREEATQAGVRAGLRRAALRADAAARWRSHEGLPAWDAEVSAGATGGRVLSLDGSFRLVDWREGGAVTSASARVHAGPFLGIKLVVEWHTGTGGAPFLTDTVGVPILTERTGYRAGALFTLGGLELGAAGLRLEADSVAVLGVVSEPPGQPLYLGGRVTGWEVTARVPTPWPSLFLEAWYTRWAAGEAWIYLPVESGRAGLVFHATPLKSGNLELLARLEGRHRGAMVVPASGTGGTGPALVVAPAAATLDFYFQLRIKDVRAFLRWENLTDRRGQWDLPGRELVGQRLFYGVKWQFRN